MLILYSKRTMLLAGLFVVVLGLCVAFLPGIFSVRQEGDEKDWLVSSETEKGVSFRYPERSPWTHISFADWPPQAWMLEGGFSCTEAGTEIDRAGRTEGRTIAGKDYCVTTILEGAAGSVYGLYAYATAYEEGTAILTFGLRFTQCSNYDSPIREECESERRTYDLDSLVDRMMRTLETDY